MMRPARDEIMVILGYGIANYAHTNVTFHDKTKHVVLGLNLRYEPKYRRNWLLSACAYNNGQQGTMRLIKSMHLTANVRLIERA